MVSTVSRRSPHAWMLIAFAMFAVGWGANQFSPMLIVYRHELRLTAGEVAGLFLVYALTLIPGLLIGGPASDRLGRRAVVWPFVALSPLATLLLVLGPRSLAVIAVGAGVDRRVRPRTGGGRRARAVGERPAGRAVPAAPGHRHRGRGGAGRDA